MPWRIKAFLKASRGSKPAKWLGSVQNYRRWIRLPSKSDSDSDASGLRQDMSDYLHHPSSIRNRPERWDVPTLFYCCLSDFIFHYQCSIPVRHLWPYLGNRWVMGEWTGLLVRSWWDEVRRRMKTLSVTWCREKKEKWKGHIWIGEHKCNTAVLVLKKREKKKDKRAVNEIRTKLTDRLTHQTSMSHSLPGCMAVALMQFQNKLIHADKAAFFSLMISYCYLG